MMFKHRHSIPAERRAQLAAEFGVDEVYDAAIPLWYLRLTSCFLLTWRRELTTVAGVFGLGIVLGFMLGQR